MSNSRSGHSVVNASLKLVNTIGRRTLPGLQTETTLDWFGFVWYNQFVGNNTDNFQE